jgi:hypothetical protein
MHHSGFVPGSVVKHVRIGPILMPLGSRQLPRLVCSVGSSTVIGTVLVNWVL